MKIISLIKIVIILSVIVFSSSCQNFILLSYEEWKDKTDDSNIKPDVYVGGYAASGIPCYWKNGIKYDLETLYSNSSYCFSIYVEGSDVYCGGTYYNGSYHNACYWKNGVLQKVNVNNTSATSIINSIHIAGGVVFSAGNEGSAACFWINENKYSFEVPSGVTALSALSITVDRETLDFYIAGYSSPYSGYWKNGREYVALQNSGNDSGPRAIAVANGKVYIGGYNSDGSDNCPCYWVDGSRVDLPYTTSGGSIIYGITISNGSIYLAGDDSSASLWKDKSLVWTSTTTSSASGVTVYDNDIYISGVSSGLPCYWKNGNLTTLPVSSTGNATCIFVKAKSK